MFLLGPKNYFTTEMFPFSKGTTYVQLKLLLQKLSEGQKDAADFLRGGQTFAPHSM